MRSFLWRAPHRFFRAIPACIRQNGRGSRSGWQAFTRAACIIMVMACATTLAGCLDMNEVGALRDQASQLKAQLNQDISQQEAALAKLDEAKAPATDPGRVQANARLASSRASAQGVDAALKQVDLVLEEAKNPTDPISAGVGAVAPFLPEPSRTPLVLGAALLATLFRARQTKTALESVAKGLDKAMREDDQFKARFKDHAHMFRAVQTPVAKRVVDEATRNGFMVRLPI